eukprot:CAMPEP_0113674926 /NCGR_PEP_ID=MMETSP0038_2-20120614/7713_1 /TAXON_ID=2898 /ORGANISM="Cryptomonas paramecium" /LENGTH=81 /DNA_ID=CAMNT_0000591607 /DNA_START=127 /DNA_END=368 /DNA_ORIENTATION=+ /assembly_acc=CAM_ASM_000170
MVETVTEWRDLTDLIKSEAFSELGKGHMLHADSFQLGDSMSALEMMDPKMDAGLVNPNITSAERCFNEGLLQLEPPPAAAA